jgi:hypothetical protein
MDNRYYRRGIRYLKSNRGNHHYFLIFIMFVMGLFMISWVKKAFFERPPVQQPVNSADIYPELDPPARVQDKYGHTAQYYSDRMYLAARAGLKDEAEANRAKMNALYSIDLQLWEKERQK